jgi:hypothetical protein
MGNFITVPSTKWIPGSKFVSDMLNWKIPRTDHIDGAIFNATDEVAHHAGRAAKWTGGVIKGTVVKAGVAGLIAGAVVAVPFVVGGMRNNRRYDPENPPMPKDMAEGLPKVVDFIPPQDNVLPQTLMGESPVVGERAQAILRQRGGMAAGLDTSSPSIMRPDGKNTIDGSSGIQDLGSPVSRSL